MCECMCVYMSDVEVKCEVKKSKMSRKDVQEGRMQGRKMALKQTKARLR